MELPRGCMTLSNEMQDAAADRDDVNTGNQEEWKQAVKRTGANRLACAFNLRTLQLQLVS